MYEFRTLIVNDSFFLGSFKSLFDTGCSLDFYLSQDTEKVSRKAFDGFITFIGKIQGRDVGIIFNDFRSLGSSFGQENSKRCAEFIEILGTKKIPLIYLCQSMGIRIQEGRSLFKNTFSLIPVIKKFSENNLYIAASFGQTLGLGAVLYSLADYKLALDGKSVFNLTGPDVFKMFLGEKVDFNELCSAKEMCQKNQLVHELLPDQESIFKKLKRILLLEDEIDLSEDLDVKEQFKKLEVSGLKLFDDFGKSVKVRVLCHKNKKIGILYNPYLRANLVSHKDLRKVRMALNLFKKMELPIYTIVDTPGADPRVSENDLNIAGEIYNVASDFIDYPYQKRGLIAGRCFGGASIFSMPVFFGGEKTLVLEGAKMGIMDKGIIKTLLKKTGPLLKEWEITSAKETSDYKDFISDGLLEKVIPEKDFLRSLFNYIT
jgi:acetyl-CoA carboxylase carboxyltransferase component